MSLELVLITGMSGSGKSVALRALEDAGYFCVDNLPPELLISFVDLEQGRAQRRVAIAMDVRSATSLPQVPAHLRDAHYGGSKKLGHGQGYQYSHDAPFGIAEQQYAPDVVLDSAYYQPTNLGAEGAIKERWERIRRLIRGR